jgi:predicted nicotinamide N-methyase
MEVGLELPYWAFAWAGGQGLARHVLDHSELVAGRRVMDFACGSGLVGLAAGRSGASAVLAVDIDPVAVESARINAALNGLHLEGIDRDIIGQPIDVDLVLAGDICYDGEWTGAVLDWLRGLGCPVLLGDPGRPYLPREGLLQLEAIEVPTEPYVEGAGMRRVGIYQLAPAAG